MDATATSEWQARNQAHLVQVLAEIKTFLRSKGRPVSEASRPAPAGMAEVEVSDSPLTVESDRTNRSFEPTSALDSLCMALNLTPFERDIILLCAGMEFDSEIATLIGEIHGVANRAFPTFGLALAVLPDPHWSALTPQSPLRYWRLVELGSGSGLTTARLKLDERILHHLTGVSSLDERLAALVEVLATPESDQFAASHADLIRRIVAIWSATAPGEKVPVIELCGADAGDSRTIAGAAANSMARGLAVLPADLIAQGADLDSFIRLWEREAILGGPILLIEGADDVVSLPHSNAIERFIERIEGPVLLSVRQQRSVTHRPAVRIDVHRPDRHEQHDTWIASLGPITDSRLHSIESVIAQFNLNFSSIRSAATELLARSDEARGDDFAWMIWDICRDRARIQMQQLAQRIESEATWDDLVLPPLQAEALRQIATHVRHRPTVYDKWDFGRKMGRGRGISVLFAGASGTGKTLAAEVLSNELQLDLYRIDLATVVSKYIGETEKNLRRVFDAAESGAAILLFDEAEALFGKRSEVKDSHDRYANLEVSYLLQRMEAYRGLAILTTNLKGHLDTAFLRRLRFVVEFPLPDVVQRTELWQRIFPPATPTEQLDFSKLAKLNLPGGNIRNIALNAAFLAAEAGTPIRMQHLQQATRAEFAKLERTWSESEIGDWS